MTTVKKRSPKKGTIGSTRKFTLLEKNSLTKEDFHPESNKANSSQQDAEVDDDYQYMDDFESQGSPNNKLLFFIGKPIDDLIHPVEEFSDHAHEGGRENIDSDDPIYDELFDNDSLPTSPVQYKEEPRSKEKINTDEEDHHNLNQMSSVTFGEEDSDIPIEDTKSSGQNRGSSPHRASSQQTVKRVFTAPKHRMIVTPARSATSSNAPSCRSHIYDASKKLKSNDNDGSSRFPRPPKSSERSSKSNHSGMKFNRINVSAVAAPTISPRHPLKNAPSVPTVGEASKISSQYSGSKATLPTKGGSTVVTAKWGVSDQGSIFHAQQRWHESELQRQLQVANKRIEEYRRLNEILHDKIDSSHVQETIDQLKYEVASKNAKIKELQKENQDLKFLARYQQKELKDQDFGLKEEYDSKMSQEKYIEVLTVHISKLRTRIQEYKASEERHIADWEESQSIIRKLRGKVTKLKKTIQKQKVEIAEMPPAEEENNTLQDNSSVQNSSLHIGHIEDNYSVGNNSFSNVSALHEEGSLASHLADYVSSKVEKRYLAKIQVLKKDLEILRLESSESSIARKKIEHELDRRELLVKRQNNEIKVLKTKFEELALQYKQLLHGCELFMGDSVKRELKQPAKLATPKPPTPVFEPAPAHIVPIIEPVSKVVAKSAVLAGDSDEFYLDNLGSDANIENNEDEKSIELPSPSENSDSPSRFFLTEEQFSTNSIVT